MIECVNNAFYYLVAGIVAVFCAPMPKDVVIDSYEWEFTTVKSGEMNQFFMPTPENKAGIIGKPGQFLMVRVRSIVGGEPSDWSPVGDFLFTPDYDTTGDACIGGDDFLDFRHIFGKCKSEGGGAFQ